MASEGGHATLAGGTPREDAIIAHLRDRFEHVSAERLLSGPGLVNLYEAIASIDRKSRAPRSAAEITAAAVEDSCSICREALDIFCALLGSAAGDAALTFAARGGVYIAGGIVPRIIEYFERSAFRRRFEAKGRFHDYASRIPSSVIIHPEPTFVGLQNLAKQRTPQ